MSSSFVLTLTDLPHYRAQTIGKLAHKLASLYSAGIPVCKMLCLSQESVKYYFESLNLEKDFEQELNNLNILDTAKIELVSAKIQKKIKSTPLPDEILLPLIKSYNQIGQNNLIHIFLSPTDDSLPQSILFKDTDTPIRAKGDANLLESIINELSRLYSPESISFRLRRQLTHFDFNVALNLQVLPDLTVSGVMETIETATNKTDEIHIETIMGLPDELLLGQVSPEVIIVKKHQWQVLHHHLTSQTYIREKSQPDKRKKILWPKQRVKQKLSSIEIESIAKYGHKIQQLFFYPQRVYWYKTKSDFFISRVEELEADLVHQISQPNSPSSNQRVLGIGEGLSPGIKTGPVRLIGSMSSLEKVKSGEIVLIQNLTNEVKKVFKTAQAIIATNGSQMSHVGILAREVQIPVVTGVKELFDKIKTGDVITVNGSTGEIYSGSFGNQQTTPQPQNLTKLTSYDIEKIHTKIFGYAQNQPPIKILQESLIQGIVGIQANEILEILKINPQDNFESINKKTIFNHLSTYLEKIIENAGDRQVFYRLHDPSISNNNQEDSGCFWLLKNPKWLMYESQLLTKVWGEHKNLNIVLPQVRFDHEILKIKKYLFAHVDNPQITDNIWIEITCANPLFEIESIIKTGIEGIIVDLDKLSLQISNLDKSSEWLNFNPLMIKGLAKAVELLSTICKTTETKLLVVSNQIIPTDILEILLNNQLYALACPQELVAMYLRELHGLEIHTLKRKFDLKSNSITA